MATILIADDEQPIRTMLAHALQEEGHTLMVAESAEQAKAKSDGYAGGIDLLITNHMLKDGLGREVAAYITQRRPAMRVLQISGYPYDELKAEGHLLPGAAFLAKPFGAHQLRAKVAKVLGHKTPFERQDCSGLSRSSERWVRPTPKGVQANHFINLPYDRAHNCL